MNNQDASLLLYPDYVSIIGGGRWARVLTEVLCTFLPPTTCLSIHSRNNSSLMSNWLVERKLDSRVIVFEGLPEYRTGARQATIVVNAAKDHEKATKWAFSAGVPVLVEKPIASSAYASQQLADEFRRKNIPFAAAHVFLFATYLDNFRSIVRNAERVRSIRFIWTDPKSEKRYGENKSYDPGLPVYADCLPHVLSIINTLVSAPVQTCKKMDFKRGGAQLDLELLLNEVQCVVTLERNSDIRRRILKVVTEEKTYQLDFAEEPGTITYDSTILSGDPNWDSSARPIAKMLDAFLLWVGGGKEDERLSIETGLLACRVIDQANDLYLSAQIPWLISRLASNKKLDDDLRYSLVELFRSDRTWSDAQIDRGINRVIEMCSSKKGASWLKKMSESKNPASLCREFLV